jgi:hypothetical protein
MPSPSGDAALATGGGRLRLAAIVCGACVVLGVASGLGSSHAEAQKKPGKPKGAGARCAQDPSAKGCDDWAGPDRAGAVGDPAAPGAGGQRLGAKGQVDPIAGLGIRNPACDRPGEIRDRRTRVACEEAGSPEGLYPASNYGFDVFIDTGIDAPTGNFVKGFVLILNGIWLGLIFVLKLVLSLLGLAFGLNPFSDGSTMREIADAIERLYRRLTQPWLPALMVGVGIWFAWKGLVRRELGASVGGTLAAIALLIVGMWVVSRPSQTVGELAEMSDQVALAVISAPREGSVSRPTGSYAEALSETWARMVEVPYSGLNFSEVKWALGPPPKEAVKKAGETYCADVGIPSFFDLRSALAGSACQRAAARRFGRPRRVIDLYLRSSPGSPSREALWDYFDGDRNYKPKVAAQGGDGALTRLAMLALFGVGLLGAVLLLAWLAIRLFMQAAVAFFLLLVAPIALFFPAFGDSGRRAFKTWGLTLIGAVLAKVIYAAFLAVVLLGITILGKVGDLGGGATGFLLSAAFSWAIFLKRTEMVGWMSVGDVDRDRGAVGNLAAFAIGSRLAGAASRSVAGGGRRAGRWAGGRHADKVKTTGRVAGEALRERASALGDERYREARRTVRAFEGGAEGAQRPDRARYQPAQSLIARAEENERTTGRRWGQADLERFAEEDRHLLASSRNPADHAHRAGYSRAAFEQLRGDERERAEEAIDGAIKRDKRRVGVISDRPGRIVGAPRRAAERARQSVSPHEIVKRQRHLRRLRRERRVGMPRSPRRNLSRGG